MVALFLRVKLDSLFAEQGLALQRRRLLDQGLALLRSSRLYHDSVRVAIRGALPQTIARLVTED